MPYLRLLALLTAGLLGAGLAAAGTAAGHGVITLRGGTLGYVSDDAPSASRLEIRGALASVSVHDPGVVGGLRAPAACRPGRANGAGEVVEYVCPAAGLRAVRVDVGPNRDDALLAVPWPASVRGASGADRIQGPDTASTLLGDQGNDQLTGGAGEDEILGGSGLDRIDGGGDDDRLETADGLRDELACGPGHDSVRADTFDAVAVDCEDVVRTYVAPPPGAPDPDDRTAPRLTIVAARAAPRAVRLVARSSEPGELAVSGFVRAGGIHSPLRSVTRRVPAASKPTKVRLALTAAQRRRVRRDLRSGRRPSVRLTVAASDGAGNVRTRRLARRF